MGWGRRIQFLKAITITHTKQSRNSPNKNVLYLQCGIDIRTDVQIYGIEESSKINPHIYSSFLTKGPREYNEGKV